MCTVKANKVNFDFTWILIIITVVLQQSSQDFITKSSTLRADVLPCAHSWGSPTMRSTFPPHSWSSSHWEKAQQRQGPHSTERAETSLGPRVLPLSSVVRNLEHSERLWAAVAVQRKSLSDASQSINQLHRLSKPTTRTKAPRSTESNRSWKCCFTKDACPPTPPLEVYSTEVPGNWKKHEMKHVNK